MDKDSERKHFSIQANVKYDKEDIRDFEIEIFEHVSDGWVVEHHDSCCSQEHIFKFYILKRPLISNRISES